MKRLRFMEMGRRTFVEKAYRTILLVALALMPVTLMGQERPIIVLHPFTAGADVALSLIHI